MTDKLTMDGLASYLKLRMVEQSEEAAESHKEAMNSYGAGHDAGMVAAFREVLAEIEGDENLDPRNAGIWSWGMTHPTGDAPAASERVVEAVARAMCTATGHDPDKEVAFNGSDMWLMYVPGWKNFVVEAAKFIAAQAAYQKATEFRRDSKNDFHSIMERNQELELLRLRKWDADQKAMREGE